MSQVCALLKKPIVHEAEVKRVYTARNMKKKTRKVVINACHGGFGLSDSATEEYKRRRGISDPNWYYYDIERDDAILIDIIERMGDDADGRFSELKIVEIPADVEWTIMEYDGLEWVAEKHRTWS